MSAKTKQATVENCRLALLAKRDELIGRLRERQSELVAGREPDDNAGVAPQTSTWDTASVSIENEIHTLTEVELALRRLESGEYGLCGSCGGEISISRLEALPWTRVCAACAGATTAEEPRQSEDPK